jgi:hypothetical protein
MVSGVSKPFFSQLPEETNLHESSLWGKYSDLIQSIVILFLDILFLVGSVFSSFPQIVTNIAFGSLNFVGFISFPFFYDLIKKLISDCIYSYFQKNIYVSLVTILKIILTITSFMLILLNSSAAIFRLINHLEFVNAIYSFTSFFAYPMLIGAVVLDLVFFALGKYILSIGFDEEKILGISEKFLDPNQNSSWGYLAAFVRAIIDKDTWKYYLTQLNQVFVHKTAQKKLFCDVLLSNIQTQQKIAISDVVLKMIGQCSMFVIILYPGGLLQASICTLLCLFYTIQLIYQKYHQYHQQSAASKIFL